MTRLVVVLVRLLFAIAFGLLRAVFVFLAAAFAPVWSHRGRICPAPAARPYAIDGDTLALGDLRVRLFGIDAPEIGQSGGADARMMLGTMIDRQNLRLQEIEIDIWGRSVCRVLLEDGTDVSAAMVRAGYAIADSRFARTYVRDERAARRARAGLWARGGIGNPRAHRLRAA